MIADAIHINALVASVSADFNSCFISLFTAVPQRMLVHLEYGNASRTSTTGLAQR